VLRLAVAGLSFYLMYKVILFLARLFFAVKQRHNGPMQGMSVHCQRAGCIATKQYRIAKKQYQVAAMKQSRNSQEADQIRKAQEIAVGVPAQGAKKFWRASSSPPPK
jgi:hypothetical protein